MGSVPAPPLNGKDSDGGAFSLAKLKGDAVVLVFYRGSFCGLCREHLKQIAANSDSYDKANVKVVGVTLDPPEAAKRTREDLKLDIPLVSAKPETFRAWGIWPDGERYPHTAAFVLDAAGRVRYGRVATNAESAVSEVELRNISRDVANSH
jgi:peroxiredoxin